ncbi:MAG: HlyD family efflux transporter periplasmic adaptor subunit [Myxococcota bacterium]
MLPAASIWLARCCEQNPGILGASLFLPGTPEAPAPAPATDAGRPAQPRPSVSAQVAARWPDPDEETSEHDAAAAAVMAARRKSVRPRPKDETGMAQPGRIVALPIELGNRSLAVFVFTTELDDRAVALVGKSIEAAGTWLPLLLASAGGGKGEGKQGLLTQMMTTLIEPEDANSGYLALVSELATALACDRVSLGILDEQVIRIQAVSHSARFDVRTRLGRSIAAAMEESIDAESSIRWPGEAERAPHRCHAELCQNHQMGSAFSVPLTAGGKPIGAISAEYKNKHPAGPLITSRMEQLATLLGPLVALRQDASLPLRKRISRSLKNKREHWFGRDRRAQQIVVVVGMALLVGLAFFPGRHRIGAPARLEGLVQRAIVAPIDGYVAESRARAGDVIEKGAVLGAIDDTDLRLERRKWTARTAQLNKEYRAAMAARDRSEANILRARLAQAKAEQDLVDERLARTLLVAPFDGVVAEGDLSRSLGSPVERGEVLFQVAPLDRYRIVLEVDETEIDEVEAGQPGWLKLTAQPGDDLALVVERVVPIAAAEDGRNFFRVEARLEEPVDSLRPGMEGVGKIEVGKRGLLWIYTHSLFDWMRLRAWSWLP